MNEARQTSGRTSASNAGGQRKDADFRFALRSGGELTIAEDHPADEGPN